MHYEKKRKSKTRNRIVVSLLAITGIAIVSFILLRPKAALYDSVTAKIGDMKTYYFFSGNVETKNRQTVMSDKIMQISEILVEEGNIVMADDVLMKTTAGVKIKSKIDGEVAHISVEENAQVMSGTKLLEIVDYINLEVNIKIDEYDISALEMGKELTVNIGAVDKVIKGTITSLSKEGQVINGISYFTATIDLEKDESVKIGMTVDLTLLSNEAIGVVTLPMSVISFDDNNDPYVLKQDKNGQAIKTVITTGINDGTIVEVKSGVSSGDIILYTNASTTTHLGFPRANRVSSNAGGA